MQLNLTELQENQPILDSLVSYVTEMRRIVEAETTDDLSVSVNFQPAFLSRTSWETAQVTRAVHFMDFDEVARMSRLYDFQALYERSEEGMVDMLAGIGDLDWEEPARALRTIHLALRRVDGFGDSLAQLYEVRLEHGFGPEPDSAGTRTLEFDGSE